MESTFEQRNPYVTVSPKIKPKKKQQTGLLYSMDEKQTEEPQQGLLGERTEPTSRVEYEQGVLTQQPYDRNAAIAEYKRRYMNAVDEQMKAQDEKAMQNSATKAGKAYVKSDSFASATGAAGSTVSDGANATAYYDSGSGMWIDANTGQGIQSGTQVPQGYTGSEASVSTATSDASQGVGDGGSSAQYLGAATGALAGYGRGKKNYYTDPAMSSGEDGFGTYHRDYRAEVGGGTLGGVIGWFGEGMANGLIGPVVDWFHPYAQDMTRDAIMLGDKAGGAYGAMMMDPAGTWSSGKYSDYQLVASGLTPLIAPIAGGKAPEIADKATNTIRDIGHSIADVFGW